MNQSAAQRCNDCLGAVTYVKAHENNADVAFDRGLGNPQFGGDLPVALAPNNQVQDFALAGAEV